MSDTLPIQICPVCGHTTCAGIMCEECRYRSCDEMMDGKTIWDFCNVITRGEQEICVCSKRDYERLLKRKESELELLKHSINMILKVRRLHE